MMLLLVAVAGAFVVVPQARVPATKKVFRAQQQDFPLVEAVPAETEFEDAAFFSLKNESLESWAAFGGAVSVVLGALYVLWIRGDTGYADDFLGVFEAMDPHLATLSLGTIFAVAHSGMAALRPRAEELVGPRAWRVIFALVSLPLAYAWILFFIQHRYDGVVLWNVRDVPGVRTAVWFSTFVSFFLLYPSTFNLKEVAAIDRPQLHLWGTGVSRITRHPQAFGQALWSLAHGLWLGTSVTLVTMLVLVAHHAFAAWHGDQRLLAKHGDDFLKLKDATSVLPFQAILDGRQQIPEDYWREWVRGPYAVVAVATLGAYFAHPYLQAYAALTQNSGLQQGGILGA
ncbi:hypothetical protein CTAYLR_009275 [Chrysophaeum taylorii]|uniref:NnrU domain-containing protein n=1 Tax=Chrysophaeum taylorii TaxID=2483200 RepID=A0AAD7UHM8_9STRA|nr:hypothetical protein CTAYLR_009275 [Chrysophaeum taylorii]